MAQNKIRVLIAGGTGLVGRHLTGMMDPDRYEIYLLTRNAAAKTAANVVPVPWNAETGQITGDLPLPDIVINLAGEGIADGYWTASRKKAILTSRVKSAETIGKWLAGNNSKPDCYIGASAVGYYGDRGAEVLTEDSVKGSGFLSDTCDSWEKASVSAGALCRRTCILRIGIVLSSKGGALPKMLMTRMMKVFGYFGDGSQYYPWIHITDLCRIMLWCIENREATGIYNAVSPAQNTCREFADSGRKATGRFGLLVSIPAFILRLFMGEMSTVLLNSDRVAPEKLKAEGFSFHFPDLMQAVRDILTRRI